MSARSTVWLLALAGVLAWAGIARAEADGKELLRDALRKRGDIRFAGTEVSERTDPFGNRHTVHRRVVHDRGQREFSEFTRAPEPIKGHRVVCDGRTRYRVMPAHKIALVSDMASSGASETDSRLEQALRTAVVEVTRRKSELTGREAVVLSVKYPSKDAGLIKARQVTVDAKTLLILENKEYQDGVETARTYLSSVDFSPNIPDSLFRYTPEPDILVLPEPTQFPKPFSERVAARIGPLAQPIPPQAFPRDWQPIGCFLQVYGSSPVLQWTFVAPHGQSRLPVVLFRRAIDDNECSFDRFYGLSRAGGDPTDAGNSALAWRADPFCYVLASRISPATLKSAGEKLARATRDLPKAPAPPRDGGRRPRHSRPTTDFDLCEPDSPVWTPPL